jgi:betaine-aldehyde dehydrogenase
MIPNYINGEWRESVSSEYLPVLNPATAEELDRVPLSSAVEVEAAVRAAAAAFPAWRRQFIHSRTYEELVEAFGLSARAMAEAVRKRLKGEDV